MAIVFCILIVGGSAFIGFQIKNYYVKRNKFFKDAISFCEIVLNETNFNKKPLKQLILENERLFCKDFVKSLDAFIYALNEGKNYTEQSPLLKEEEKNFFQNFLSSLGKSGLEVHNNIVEFFKEKIKIKVEKEMDGERKKGSAIFKVSICVGLMLAILLV